MWTSSPFQNAEALRHLPPGWPRRGALKNTSKLLLAVIMKFESFSFKRFERLVPSRHYTEEVDFSELKLGNNRGAQRTREPNTKFNGPEWVN